MSKKLTMSIFAIFMMVGMASSVAALDSSDFSTDRGHILVDFETSEEPTTAEVYLNGELEADLDDGITQQSDTDYSVEIDSEAQEHQVELVVNTDQEHSVTETVEVVDYFTYGEDVTQELTVSKDRDDIAEGLGLYQEPTTLNTPVVLEDGTEIDEGTRVQVEAYSKIALVEGNMNQDADNVEIIWEGTPSLLPSDDPWDQIHPDTVGNLEDSHTFEQTLYEEGEYSYVVYLASAVTEYDQLNDEWTAPAQEVTEDGHYSIYEEDLEVYPFQIVEPEEPPSAFAALTQFLDSQLNTLFNLFR